MSYISATQVTSGGSATSPLLLPSRIDQYNGVTVFAENINGNHNTFQRDLEYSQEVWQREGRKGVWLNFELSRNASLIDVAAKQGFTFHHAEGTCCVMIKWLPESENKIPRYAYHNFGVAGIVINEDGKILLVSERRENSRNDTKKWRIPGGALDPDESIGECAVREIFEETGVLCHFQSIVSFRHSHSGRFNGSDIFFGALLIPLTSEISIDPTEIADAQWFDIEAFIEDPKTDYRNKLLARLAWESFKQLTGPRGDGKLFSQLLPVSSKGKPGSPIFYEVRTKSLSAFQAEFQRGREDAKRNSQRYNPSTTTSSTEGAPFPPLSTNNMVVEERGGGRGRGEERGRGRGGRGRGQGQQRGVSLQDSLMQEEREKRSNPYLQHREPKKQKITAKM